MAYFNEYVLKAPLLSLDIVSPQRHLVGSIEGGSWFIKAKTGGLALKSILVDFEQNDVNNLKDHEIVYDGNPGDNVLNEIRSRRWSRRDAWPRRRAN